MKRFKFVFLVFSIIMIFSVTLITGCDFFESVKRFVSPTESPAPEQNSIIKLTGVKDGGFTKDNVTATLDSIFAEYLSISYSYNTDGTFPTEATSEYELGTEFTEEGNYLIVISDSAGNSKSYTFTIDKTAPTLTLQGVNKRGFANMDVIATWDTEIGSITSQRANDNDVLTVKYSYTVGDDFPTSATTPYTEDMKLSEDGKYLITISDSAGNTASYTFTIDSTALMIVLSGVSDGGFTNTDVTAMWNDALSKKGAEVTVKYSFNTDGTFPTTADTKCESGVTFTTAGNYYMEITDASDNLMSYTFTIDKSAPTLTLSGVANSGFTNGNVSATWGMGTGTATSQCINDDDVLTVKYSYSTNGTFPTTATNTYSSGTSLTEAGNYYMTITDKAGNETSYRFTIDKSSPTLTLSGVANSGFTNGNVSATWGTGTGTATSQRINDDDVLTVKYSYSTNGTFPTTAMDTYSSGTQFNAVGNYYMTITDKAGNETSYRFTIDKSAPMLNLSGVYNGGFSNTEVSATWSMDISSMASQRVNSSDVLTVKYSYNTDGTYPTSATVSYSDSEKISATGYYLMTITDSAGNTTSYTFRVDTSVPSYISTDGTKFAMTWCDEFDGDALDTDKWYYEIGQGYGTQAGWAWGTQEKQTYTNSNTTVSDGTLKITAKKSNDGYTSARINTRGSSITNGNVYDKNAKFAQKYGRFEARIKLPEGQGLWPAFWMMPVSNNYNVNGKTMWPFNGEIDIMEAKGRLSTQMSSAVHYAASNGCDTYKSGWYGTSQLGNGFRITNWHIYAVEWNAENIVFFVDNIKTLTVNRSTWHTSYYNGYSTSAPYDQPFYIILNLAVGGQFDNGVTPDTNFTEATMEVDYVRVYQYYDILNHPQ